ncbi:Crp/Fnr family transcriptional regulator [Mucilaginibacter sp. HC2]|uniref:Crp/Fnr family transcriptional regulator n=1 Tax=Mucilaginibacter inviolabilis TaxID=2714892 RepID=UPI00140E7150|nr:Crp/Fnr family transcriptional regulator [Mucilaginibacter inviolabilis]NHA05944.1 Crp/Fnr family transcriptional regulator [Mucilaginibacter inviolabilis]
MATTTFDSLIQHVQKRVSLTEAELAEMLSYFSVKNIKKKQFIIQPDFVARHRNYIVEGAFRAYVIDEKGEERTIQFAIEDWWISDYNSYIYQQPATMFVLALEDSVVLRIDHDQEQRLKAANHKFETFFRIMAERSSAFMQRRIISNLTQSAEERYTDFLEKYPLVAQRLPQYALASYLGMTTEFLSKIRNNKVRRKS